MFEYFRELEEKGDSLIVTDFGRPVLQIIPYKMKESTAEIFKDIRGKVKLDRKEVLKSTEEEWNLE